MFKALKRKNSLIERIEQIPVEEIIIKQNRSRHIDFSDIVHLAASIERVGLLNPILVKRVNDKYYLVAGESRLRACILLKHKTIRAVVVEDTEAPEDLLSLHENIFSCPFNEVEVSHCIKKLTDSGFDPMEVAESLQISEQDIEFYFTLNNLPDSVRYAALEHNLDRDFIKRLALLESTAKMESAIRRYVRRRVRIAEEAISPNESIISPLKSTIIRADKRVYLNTLYDTLKKLEACGMEVVINTEASDNETLLSFSVKEKSGCSQCV